MIERLVNVGDRVTAGQLLEQIEAERKLDKETLGVG
jgi:multidrug efflux pump subunit AcrA (membrane-fusion protein)